MKPYDTSLMSLVLPRAKVTMSLHVHQLTCALTLQFKRSQKRPNLFFTNADRHPTQRLKHKGTFVKINRRALWEKLFFIDGGHF